MIPDNEIDKALDYLRDNANKAAQARADRIYLEEYRKSLKAILMSQSNESVIAAQERYAYAHVDYFKHLQGLKAAVFKDEKHRFLLAAARAKIDAWRTQESTKRSVERMV